MFQTIQAMRGIAAIAVAMFHFSILLADQRYLGHSVLESLTWRGDLGVDFFFVLSGFIIIHAHQGDIGNPKSWRRFAWNRVARIFPLYLLITIGVCILIWLGYAQVKRLPEAPSEWLVTLMLLRIDTSAPLLAPAWSLVHELAFYAIFSVLLFNRRLGGILLGFWFLACLTVHSYPNPAERTPVNTYLSGFNLDFLFGILCFFGSKRAAPVEPKLIVLAAAAAIGALLFFELQTPGKSWYRLYYGGCFAVMLYGLIRWEVERKITAPKILVLTGNASFAVYLTHELFLGFLTRIAIKKAVFPFLGEIPTYILVVALTVVMGIVVHLLIEKPIIKLTRRIYPSRKSGQQLSISS